MQNCLFFQKQKLKTRLPAELMGRGGCSTPTSLILPPCSRSLLWLLCQWPEDQGCSCEIPNRNQSKGHCLECWQVEKWTRSYKGMSQCFTSSWQLTCRKKYHWMLNIKLKAKAELCEALLGQNAPCSEAGRGREGWEVSTPALGLGGMALLWAWGTTQVLLLM